MQKNGMLQAKTWVYLPNIKPSEGNLIQMNTACMISCTCISFFTYRNHISGCLGLSARERVAVQSHEEPSW